LKLLNPEQVSEILGISRSTALRMMHEQQIPTIKLRSGKRKSVLRVSEETLARWITSKERESHRAPKLAV
jgi:predicted site-specific integrase-resolvase